MKQPKNTHNLPEGIFDLLCRVKKDFHINRVLLFGSRARGDFKERSDIDLAFEAPDLTSVQWNKLQDIVLNNSLSLLKIDIVRFDQIKDENFKTRIEKECIEIN